MRKIIIEHAAKFNTLYPPEQEPAFLMIAEENAKEYYIQCLEELLRAKNTKLPNSWITFFDFLVSTRKKIKNNAGNTDLIKKILEGDCVNNFPIYKHRIEYIVEKGIMKRCLFDKSSVALSKCLPILNPNHLIIRDILDCILSKKHLSKLSK